MFIAEKDVWESDNQGLGALLVVDNKDRAPHKNTALSVTDPDFATPSKSSAERTGSHVLFITQLEKDVPPEVGDTL